ncbi:MAG TPA: hypothetical protein VL283_04510 [Candidatus Baltobacteraceae bacterium]|nr:hypothetical protein [Candidatus Baltobacteraceae bacterium]
MKKSVFLICPVRNASQEALDAANAYVADLETKGYSVHWPPRDTAQDDPVGLRICRDNGRALLAADEVHVWYDPASQGSVFDFGMLFMASEVIGPEKKVVLVNPESVTPTEGKSFQNVLLALVKESA